MNTLWVWPQSSSGHVIMDFEREIYNTSVWSQVGVNYFERYVFFDEDFQNEKDSEGIVFVLMPFFIYMETSDGAMCFNK